MQRSFLVCVILLSGFSVMKGSPSLDLFSYDAVELQSEMEPLQQIENLILEGEDFSAEYFIINKELSKPACAYFSSDPAIEGFFSNVPRDIPPFVWGCLLSGFGVALVYNATHDNEDTKKAFMGCIVNGLVLTSLYIINLMANT